MKQCLFSQTSHNKSLGSAQTSNLVADTILPPRARMYPYFNLIMVASLSDSSVIGGHGVRILYPL